MADSPQDLDPLDALATPEPGNDGEESTKRREEEGGERRLGKEELENRFSRKLFTEVAVLGQLGTAALALTVFLVYLVNLYIDILFSIDFTAFDWSYLNQIARLFVILVIAAFDVHLIHQLYKLLARRTAVMALLKEMNDLLEAGGKEPIWRLRALLWDERNADLIEDEGYFLSLRDNIEASYKTLIDLRDLLTGVIDATREKKDIIRFTNPIRAAFKDAGRRFGVLKYPWFMDTGYSQGVRFYGLFHEQVIAMLDEIERLMNQFEYMAKLEDERKLEREKAKRLELERQHKVNEFSLESHLETFLKRIDELTPERLKGKMHGRFLQLYGVLKGKFESAGLIAADRLLPIADEVYKIDQIEDIIAFYDEKIRTVKNDSIDLTERRDKAKYWTQLRDQHVAELKQRAVRAGAAGPAAGPP